MKTIKLSHKNLLIALTLTCGATLGLVSSLAEVSLAQTAQDLQTYPSNERDPMTSGNGLNPLDLMHQLQLSNSRSMSEFMLDSQQNIDSAANDFKRQQQQILLTPKTEAADNAENTTVETENQ